MVHFGWKPDALDVRDESLSIAPQQLESLPASASLAHLVAQVLDQGRTSSCVAHAIAYAVQVQQFAHAPHKPAPQLMSRLFDYYCARNYTDDQNEDDGTYLRNGIKACAKLGFCPESVFPFDAQEVNRQPPLAAFRAAADQRYPTAYYRIDSYGQERRQEIKACIAAGNPLVFGMTVSEAFIDWHGPGYFVEDFKTPIAGGHAMCCVEYDEQGVRGPQSWGLDGGDAGWWAMAWSCVDSWRDIWVIKMTLPEYT